MDYEDLYRIAWHKQNRRDLIINPKCGVRGPRATAHASSPPVKPAAVPVGGFPKMDLMARAVNKLVKGGRTSSQIGKLFDVSHQTITGIKKKYGLPRGE